MPRSYLKRWSDDDGKVSTYRLLVPTDRAPLWKRFSLKSVAFQQHLYTTVVAGGESDGIERWLDAEFEGPAEGSIRRVVAGGRLSREDWSCLIRFLAAQDARTPARLEASMARNDKWLPEVLERTLAKLARTQGTEAQIPETRLALPEELRSAPLPFCVSVRPSADGVGAQVVAEAINGRALWLMGVRRALTGPPIKVLLGHR